VLSGEGQCVGERERERQGVCGQVDKRQMRLSGEEASSGAVWCSEGVRDGKVDLLCQAVGCHCRARCG
jgi:hypothetical protein